jgi:prevent-host-death family protein
MWTQQGVLENKMGDLYVGVRDLKNRLSKYLREVKKGRSIVITERGKPIGQIIPKSSSIDDRVEMMINAGLLEWNGNKLEHAEPVVVNRSSRLVSDILVDMRE